MSSPPEADGAAVPRLGSARRDSTLVAAGILLSRVSGFVRQRAIGHFLGVGPVVDAFTAALKIPNLLQNLLGEGVLSASFIPVYARLLARDRPEEAGRVAGAIAGLLALLAGVLVVIGVVFAGPLTSLIAPGFSGERYDLTVRLMRVLTPGIGFLVLSAWCLGILNSHRRFFLSYVAPVIWNAAQITALVAFGLAGLQGAPLAEALAWGTFIGGGLQFAVQVPGVLRLTSGLRLSLNTALGGVRATVRAFGPVVAGRGVVQLMTYVELLLASLLAAGAISSLAFAQQLYILPISLFGMSVAAAELPELSGTAREDAGPIGSRLDDGLARVAFYVAPSTLAFFVIGDLIVAALYRTGAFGRLDVLLVWLVLAGFSVGLLANTASRLLQSALYAHGDARTPAVIAAARVCVAAAVGAVLMFQFDRVALTASGLAVTGDLPALRPLTDSVRRSVASAEELRLGAVGLALAAGGSAWLEFALLRRRVAGHLGHRTRPGGGRLGRTLAAVAVAGVGALAVRIAVGGLHPLLAAPLACAVTGLVYLLAARAVGLEEARFVQEWLLARIRRR